MKDLRFANELLRIRTKSSLTQAMVAQQIGVSEKSLQKWEGGYAYPTIHHIQKLITLFLNLHTFEPGRELEEAEEFWQLVTECSRREREPFDEKWFRLLLTQPAPTSPSGKFFSSTHAVPHTQFRRGVWDDAMVGGALYGRQQELAQMQQWIIEDAIPMVVILGMGGVGKSALSVELSRMLAQQHQFEYVFWFSLQNPSLERIMTHTLRVIAADQQIPLPQENLPSFCNVLIEHHCLLILDNFDALLSPDPGTFRPEYQDYARLLSLFLSHRHHSCLLITSREAIPLDALLTRSPVRQIRLKGLGIEAERQLLSEKKLLGRDEHWQELNARYGGNPLALRMVAQEIHELFEGDVAEFLHQDALLFRGVRELLSGQVERLPALARDVLYWLAIEAIPLSLDIVRRKFLHRVPALLDQVKLLWEHNLVEHGEREGGTTFLLQPIIREFLTEQIIERVVHEVEEQAPLYILTNFAFLEAQGKEYIRVNQMQTFLLPILDRLRAERDRKYTIDQQLQRILQILCSMPLDEQGYGGGNILNLLAILNGQLHHIDASGLVIRQGYFCHTPIHDAQFVQADLTDSLFCDPVDIISTVALNASGAIVLGGDYGGRVSAWRIEDATLLFSLRKHDRMAWSLQFHPTQDNLFCTAGYEGVIHIWDLSRHDVIATLAGHTNWVDSLCFAPDGRLASCSLDGTIRIWDVEKQVCVHVLSVPGETMHTLAFSPDGRLVSGSETGTIFWWDLVHERPSKRLANHDEAIFSLAFSPDGQLLAIGSGENLVRIYRQGALLYTLRGHAQRVFQLAFLSTQQLVTASNDSVRIWSLNEEQRQSSCLWALKGPSRITSLSAPPSTTRFAIGHHDGSVSVWQRERENTFYPVRTFQGSSHLVGALRWSKHGYLAGTSHGHITLWAMPSRRIVRTLLGHVGCIHDLDFSSDGQVLASGSSSEEKTLLVWDVQSGRCLQPQGGPGEAIWSLRFAPDDRFFATSDWSRSVRIWNPLTGQCLSVLSGFDTWVWSMAFLSAGDKTILACGEFGGTISFWNLDHGRCYQSIVMPSLDPVTALAFRPDGTLLMVNNSVLCACYDQTGQCLWTIPAEKRFDDWLTAVTFSRDATLLARVDRDEILIWSLPTGDQIQHLSARRYQGPVWSVEFSPDGKQLASGDATGTIALWDITTGVCLDVLRPEKRPYEQMNITNAKLTDSQRHSLFALGAIEQSDREDSPFA